MRSSRYSICAFWSVAWFARPSQQFTSLIALNDSGVLKAATGNPFSYTRISPELCSQLTAKCASVLNVAVAKSNPFVLAGGVSLSRTSIRRVVILDPACPYNANESTTAPPPPGPPTSPPRLDPKSKMRWPARTPFTRAQPSTVNRPPPARDDTIPFGKSPYAAELDIPPGSVRRVPVKRAPLPRTTPWALPMESVNVKPPASFVAGSLNE